MNTRLRCFSLSNFSNLSISFRPFLLGIILSLGLVIVAHAQNYVIDNTKAIPLEKSYSSFGFLKDELQGVNYLALGEASHGTEEFYRVKSTMVKHLVRQLKFKVLAFEMEETVAAELNNYVEGHEVDAKAKLKSYGLYNSQSLLDLLKWMRQYNQDFKVQAADKLKIIGFDSQAYWGDPFARDSLMAKGLIAWVKDSLSVDHKIMIWSHNTHLVRSNTWDVTNSGIKSMGNLLAKVWGDAYYFLAFDTNQGSFNVVEDGLKAYEFKQHKNLKIPTNRFFFLSYKNKPLGASIHYPLTTLFSNWQGEPEPSPAKPGIDFDGLIYIHETTASKIIR